MGNILSLDNMFNLIFCFILIITSFPLFAKTFHVVKSHGNFEIFDNKGIKQSSSKIDYGYRIKTKANSFLKIKTPKNHMMVVGPSSEVVLEQVSEYDERTLLDILKGQIRMQSDGVKKEKIKFFIRSKTASMGVRGTDFHIIYNPLNKITSTISYSGDVQMRKIHPQIDYVDDMDAFLDSNHTIKVPKGSFSGSYIGYEKLADPTKISPEQFSTLEKNNELAMNHLLTEFDGDSLDEASDIELVPPPTEEFIPDRDMFIGEKVLTRPGGYIDLNTGIYVSPPEDAPYDKDQKVYQIPEEKGQFDKESGEYIPPLGLILHPLEGFKLASQKVLGKLKGVREESVKRLEEFAQQLNQGFGISYLQDLHQFIQGNSFLNKIRFDLKAEFEYDSNIIQKFYDEIIHVTDQASVIWFLDSKVGYRKFIYKNWYIHPHLFFIDKIHFRAHTPEVKNQDHYLIGARIEMGRRGVLWSLPSQVSFSIGQYADRKRILPSQSYENYIRADQLETKLFLKMGKHWSTQASLLFEDYQRREGYEGQYWNALPKEVAYFIKDQNNL